MPFAAVNGNLNLSLVGALLSLPLSVVYLNCSAAQENIKTEEVVNYINYLVDPCKRIRFPESEKNFARGIGNRGIFACGILNTGQGIRNPTDDWSPESKSSSKEFGNHLLESLQNSRLSWISIHGVKQSSSQQTVNPS